MEKDEALDQLESWAPRQAGAVPDSDDAFEQLNQFDPLVAKKKIEEIKKPEINVLEDVIKTIPSSVVKGFGAIPQLPALSGNAIVNAAGYVAGRLKDVDEEKLKRLSNINPFYVGNTPLDAIVTSINAIRGEEPKHNPITGRILHDPETTAGRYANALTQALVAGPSAGTSYAPSAAAAVGAQTGSELYPGNPVVPLVSGLGSYGVGKVATGAITPKPLSAEVANVIKNTENKFGIRTPSGVMSNKSNLLEKVAGKTDSSEMASQVNKVASDLIGANDAGAGHTALNQKTFLDAQKNNSAAYNEIFTKIGDVPLTNYTGAINNVLNNMNTKSFSEIGKDIIGKMNSNGTIPASAIKELTKESSVLQKYANNKTDTPSSLAAQEIIDTLETALKDHATPEQYAQLKATDVKYKTMMSMKKLARKSGVGAKADINAIRDNLNNAFSDISDNDLAPVDFSNYLNTISPPKGVSGEISGVARHPSEFSNNLLSGYSGVEGLVRGEPLTGAAVALTTKYAPKVVSNLASKAINTDWYRNRLLKNAGP